MNDLYGGNPLNISNYTTDKWLIKDVHLDMFDGKKLIIIGENHVSKQSENFTLDVIDTVRSDFLLQEHTGWRDVVTERDKKLWLNAVHPETKNVDRSKYPYNMFTHKWLLHSLEHHFALIGIDYKPANDSWDEFLHVVDKAELDASFRVREERMVEVLHKYKGKGGCAVASIGNDHIRSVAGGGYKKVSPIWEEFKNDKDVLIFGIINKQPWFKG